MTDPRAHSGALLERAEGNLKNLRIFGDRVGESNRARFADALDFRKSVFDENTGRTFDDDTFNRIFAAQADRVAGDFIGNQDIFSESLGLRGVSGGVAAQAAGNLRQNFLSNLSQVSGNLRVAQLQSDAADANRNLQAGFSLSDFMATPEDETQLAVESAIFQGHSELAGTHAGIAAGDQASRDIRRGQDQAFVGDLIGGGLGLFRGIF